MNRRLRRRKGPANFAVPLNQRKGPPPGVEVLPWFWHPDRDGSQPCPKEFHAQLIAIHPDLRVCFNPVMERWVLWVKNPRIQHEMCRGWQLLMFWEHSITKEYLPLSNLLFHNLMLIDATKYQGAKDYFKRIQDDVERQKQAKNNVYEQDRDDRNEDMRLSHQISTAGKGNKSALHDTADIVPSAGDIQWRQETRRWRLPKEILDREAREKEQRAYGR